MVLHYRLVVLGFLTERHRHSLEIITQKHITLVHDSNFVLFLSIWMPMNFSHRDKFAFPFNSFSFHQNWTLSTTTRALFMKRVLCYKLTILGPQWHAKAHLTLTAETDSYRRTNFFLNAYYAYKSRKNGKFSETPCQIIFEICWSIFNLLIKTKIV